MENPIVYFQHRWLKGITPVIAMILVGGMILLLGLNGFGWGDQLRLKWYKLQSVYEPLRTPADSLPYYQDNQGAWWPHQLSITIDPKSWSMIQHWRNKAVKLGVITPAEKKFFPATIEVNHQTIPVKLRLKGDWADHVNDDQMWSFRVRVLSPDQSVMGVREFSIQHPGTRLYHYETNFMEMARALGLITPRYFFVHVLINGQNVGVMALEEYLDRTMLEAQGVRAGPIIRYDETLFWHRMVLNSRLGDFQDPAKLQRSPYTEAIGNHVTVVYDPELDSEGRSGPLAMKAKSMLEAYQLNKLKAEAVFDMEKMERYWWLSLLSRTSHTLHWINQRYYLNPITQKLEPVVFDTNAYYTESPYQLHHLPGQLRLETLRQMIDIVNQPTVKQQLIDSESKHLTVLKRQYSDNIRFLKPINRQQLTNFFEWVKPQISTLSRYWLRKPLLTLPSPLEALPPDQHKVLIKASLYPLDKTSQSLVLLNLQPYPVVIDELNWVKSSKNDFLAHSKVKESVKLIGRRRLPLVLRPSMTFKTMVFESIPVQLVQGDLSQLNLEVVSRIQGYHHAIAVRAQSYEHSPPPKKISTSALAGLPFIESASSNASIWRVKPGTWSVTQMVEMPTGTTLIIPAGVTLKFAPNTGIISYGAIHIQGTKQQPVLLKGLSAQPWLGVLVMSDGVPSTWTYAQVDHTQGWLKYNQRSDAGVTFYESPLICNHCQFSRAQAEDALNVVRAKVALNQVEVRSCSGDGIDLDYVTGTVSHALFHDLGSDGLDVSGSQLLVNHIKATSIGDKALSVGEASQLEATDLAVDGARTGVAAKDMSVVKLNRAELSKIRMVGLAAYQKKPTYGPARLEAAHITMHQVFEPTMSAGESVLWLEGHLQRKWPKEAGLLMTPNAVCLIPKP